MECSVSVKVITNFNKTQYYKDNLFFTSGNDIINYIEVMLDMKNKNYHLYDAKTNQKIDYTNITNNIVNGKLSLVLCYIVKPECSKFFASFNGLLFYFHTNESTHKHNPHIHVKYGNEEISIYLNDFRVIGSFKNKKKVAESIKYVNLKIDKIKQTWKSLIK